MPYRFKQSQDNEPIILTLESPSPVAASDNMPRKHMLNVIEREISIVVNGTAVITLEIHFRLRLAYICRVAVKGRDNRSVIRFTTSNGYLSQQFNAIVWIITRAMRMTSGQGRFFR